MDRVQNKPNSSVRTRWLDKDFRAGQDPQRVVLPIIKFNSIQFFIIYVPSQQPQGQLEAQHSVDTDNYIMDKHNIKSKTS
jgi:hypothetical protein